MVWSEQKLGMLHSKEDNTKRERHNDTGKDVDKTMLETEQVV